jgi:hypothetical protein
MESILKVTDIYQHSLNFLFGAGASKGFLPTLALEIRDENDNPYTIETLAKAIDVFGSKQLKHLLFIYYYKECIQSGLPNTSQLPLTYQRKAVLQNYKAFLKTLLSVLDKQDRNQRKCNIYTTNYDNCFELAADQMITEEAVSFFLNDGTSGFQHPRFHTKKLRSSFSSQGDIRHL